MHLSFGDGGSANDPLDNGQKTTTFFSKILRIDVDNPSGGRAYGIPAGNPFASGGGEPAAFAYGFRNPFRFSVDRATGEVWVGDVGQGKWEEVDAKIVAGGNYGWRSREGKHCFNPSQDCPTAGLIDPLWEYDHSVGQSITGGVVYRGSAMPSLVGAYVIADFVSGTVWALQSNESGTTSAREVNGGGGGSWVAFGEDNGGEVYGVCAGKERFFAIPNGKTITVSAGGDFDLPTGSVTVKTFSLGGSRVETRLFVRHDDGGWAGYTYEWNDAQTDATLLPASKTKLVGSQNWYFPSRAECLQCHTSAAGRTLGLETTQLNGDRLYATGRTANQLRTLEAIGMFSAPLWGGGVRWRAPTKRKLRSECRHRPSRSWRADRSTS